MGLFEPHGRHRDRDGGVPLRVVVTGRLGGIARHGRPKGPIETLERAAITLEGGIQGDYRGTIKPGGRGRRQVTLMERGDWAAAMAEVGYDLPWHDRRVNLLVDGLDLPQQPGATIRIGTAVVLVVTRECDPCHRMDTLAPGLKIALTPDWRGGVCTRVVAGGTITIDDEIRIEIS